jgi:hypothetical protein
VYVDVRLLVSPCLVPNRSVSVSTVPVLLDVQGIREHLLQNLLLALRLVTGVWVGFDLPNSSDFITCHHLCPTFECGLWGRVSVALGWWL